MSHSLKSTVLFVCEHNEEAAGVLITPQGFKILAYMVGDLRSLGFVDADDGDIVEISLPSSLVDNRVLT